MRATQRARYMAFVERDTDNLGQFIRLVRQLDTWPNGKKVLVETEQEVAYLITNNKLSHPKIIIEWGLEARLADLFKVQCTEVVSHLRFVPSLFTLAINFLYTEAKVDRAEVDEAVGSLPPQMVEVVRGHLDSHTPPGWNNYHLK